MAFTPRNLEQNKAIHALLGKHRFDREAKADMVADITGGRAESTKEMSFEEANVMIARLGGEPIHDTSPAAVNRRTLQYRRQKTGVVSIDIAKSKKLLGDLWLAVPGRKDSGLAALATRILKHYPPLTTAEYGKVIEAVKSMNKRTRSASAAGETRK
jgi:hypothetical protein